MPYRALAPYSRRGADGALHANTRAAGSARAVQAALPWPAGVPVLLSHQRPGVVLAMDDGAPSCPDGHQRRCNGAVGAVCLALPERAPHAFGGRAAVRGVASEPLG